ncbi:histidine kinase [Mastigocoleus sp. MO_188.B34]|uniref:histidine kinase n=1 Tax=Mastigocoleus sp. MO_188.B34 TaxID=3036635 RepID=UPI002626E30C|nr:histidine kinase [Mastigocoleus sp. MO_188.B34]MDJ0695795.1 histidine kinase [Mastigocoleus sp. MO_188.B34]
MQLSQDRFAYTDAPLQLILFIDGRPKSGQQVQRIRSYLKELKAEYQFELEIVDVGQQPYLAEQFKLVATPALVKIHPEPRHILAGSNIISQLQVWWPRWQVSVEMYFKSQVSLIEDSDNAGDTNKLNSSTSGIKSLAVSAELMKLSDEIFHLKQEKDKLEEQLQFKDRVIAMLAHDLRNPLTAAAIAVETLQSNYIQETGTFKRLTPSLAAKLLRQARTQTRIIDKMIAELLQVGRGKETKIPIVPQKAEVGKLCCEVMSELRQRYKAKSLKLEKDIPEDLPLVYADPERIRQVLINLMDNAIKYTPEGGVISISGLHRTTQKVQFSIGDSGPGIPEEKREQIFENHYRLERDEEKDGYGIGLCLCQRIITAHYGQIWVEKAPTGGAWFHFTLPVYPT